ncbi:uncharacterized protein CDV56_108250 [Aspergillus thermomutatus]|uniref:Uncharacterized protein n=1 Tax=Aspergillus thermomutatus TaxID=41047 RepID=A0A397HDV7_ASPTH|nr:uncharacterized protein CDV56_108250 [Aspergillus thermomutatus]RHZ60228.1 hypothetical protein CDV56_108250 [Aspergillus thermomutatus]
MVGLAVEHNIKVNDGPLTSENAALLRPSDPDLPMDELRHRYDQDGYLFLKHLLPREDVLEARRQYFSLLAPTGVLKEGSDPVEGIFNPAKSPDEYPGIGAGAVGNNGRPGGDKAAQFVDLAIEAHYQDWYAETFCHHPALAGFVARFTGWGEQTLNFRRTLLRNNTPRTKPIGVHYDQIFLRHGEPTSVTAWVPMGDVKINGGGLIYLEDGDPVGLKIEEEFTTKATQAGLTDEEARSAFNANMMATGLLSESPVEFARQHGRRWLVSAYEAGDVVLHKPHTIHASTVNHDPDNVIRLATDLRFCDSSKPYDKFSSIFRFSEILQLPIAISPRPPMTLKSALYDSAESILQRQAIRNIKYRVMTSQIGNLVAAIDLAGCLDVELVNLDGYAVCQLAEEGEEEYVSDIHRDVYLVSTFEI